jgi:hypothetical protein
VPTTKNDMPAKRRYGSTTQLLSYLSAAGCGISLLALGALVTVAVGKQIGETLLQPGNEIMGLVGNFIGICVVGCLVVASGVACGRFLLRALPPAMSHPEHRNRSSGVVAFYIAFISLYVLGICVFLVSREAQPDRDSLGLFENLVGNLLAAMLWAGSAIGLLIRRHHKPRGFLERPFVLFLRRFSTFPDRAVIAVILKQASYEVPVVFLTPTLSRARDWDPYLVGLAGLKLLHPWRSAPIVIRARDDAWQEAADELIRRAHAILARHLGDEQRASHRGRDARQSRPVVGNGVS